MFINQNDGYQGTVFRSFKVERGMCLCYVTTFSYRRHSARDATAIIVVIIAAVITIILSSARAYRRGYPRLMEQGCVADSRAQWWWGCCFFSRDIGSLSSCWREGERSYKGKWEEGRNGGRQKGEREATDREKKREARGRAGREYLRIAADIMLICERGCMPDKPPVYRLSI